MLKILEKMLIDKDQEQYEAQNNCPLAYTYTNNKYINY